MQIQDLIIQASYDSINKQTLEMDQDQTVMDIKIHSKINLINSQQAFMANQKNLSDIWAVQSQFSFILVANKYNIIGFIVKICMIKRSSHTKPLVSKYLQLTYKQFLSRNKTLTGFKIGSYIVTEKLGQGSFGSVFSAIQESSPLRVAVKVIDLEVIDTQPNFKLKTIKKRLAKTQTEMMLKCQSDNLVKCYDVFQNKSLKIMVIEYCNQGSLQDKIDKMIRIPQSNAVQILIQILNGLSQLHKNKIIHRDLKPQNILIHQGVCKIADFGFSKQLISNNFANEIVQTNLGTLAYMAPQVRQRKKYGLNADIWSVGVIFFTMLYGKCPFDQMSKKQIQAQIKSKSLFDSKPYQKDVRISPQSRQFILQCLDLDSQKRLNWQNIISHKLFYSYANLKTKESSIIFSSEISQSLLDIVNMKDLDQTDFIFDDITVQSQDQEVKSPQVVRAMFLVPEQFAKIQQQSKKMMSTSQLPWSKLANFQCLKAQFILEQIVEPLEFLPSKFSQSKEMVQILYLVVARCFQDVSAKYWERQRYRHKVIVGFMKILQNLYSKMEKKFDYYEQKLSAREKEMFDVIKDKLFEFFGEKKQSQERSVFFTCNKKNLQKGLALGKYTKAEQIAFTQSCLDKQMQRISKQVSIAKNVMKYTNNYERICKLTVKEVGDAYFKTYVTNLL